MRVASVDVIVHIYVHMHARPHQHICVRVGVRRCPDCAALQGMNWIECIEATSVLDVLTVDLYRQSKCAFPLLNSVTGCCAGPIRHGLSAARYLPAFPTRGSFASEWHTLLLSIRQDSYDTWNMPQKIIVQAHYPDDPVCPLL